MKIRYLNGDRLYQAVLAGGNAVIQDQNYLNRINVFPVPDADTGTNLASTMRSISAGASASRSIKETLRSISDTALSGARGNSGIIFAQFLVGIFREVENREKLSTQSFGDAVKAATHYAYRAMADPVEGTMLTVIRDWADAVYQQRIRLSDFSELLAYSLEVARQSLKDTPKKLQVLAKAGVVDAGAKGFVDFLEGIVQFMARGKLSRVSSGQTVFHELEPPAHVHHSKADQRYCTEALLTEVQIDLDMLRDLVSAEGSSAIVAGSEEKARIHVHTDRPDKVFQKLCECATITQVKVDDMLRQFQAAHSRIYETALVTDSACDLPAEILDAHQIHLIPFTLSFGDTLYLDKLTLAPDRFYSLLKTEKQHPKTAQPGMGLVKNTYTFLSSQYKDVLAVHISQGLTGMYQTGLQAQKEIGRHNIHLIDTRHISVSQGLIVLRAAQAIEQGVSIKKILSQIPDWIEKTRVLVDVATLKYFVRGGRVSPLKGAMARLLHLKPIISLDEEGRSFPYGKSLSRSMTMNKILKAVEEWANSGKIWNYAVVHALNPDRAGLYVDKIRTLLGQEPVYVTEVSPVIGAHSGIGAVAIAVMRA